MRSHTFHVILYNHSPLENAPHTHTHTPARTFGTKLPLKSMLCMRLNDTIPLKFHPSQTRTRMPCILYLLYIPCARARVRVVCARRACKCAEQNACSNTHRHARTHARTWRRGVQYPPPLYFGSVKRAVYLVYSYAGAFCAPAHSRRRRRRRRRRRQRGVRFRGRTK